MDSDFFIPGGLLESMGADDFGGDDAMMLSMEERGLILIPVVWVLIPSRTEVRVSLIEIP
mgnify:CR=1 FL=1